MRTRFMELLLAVAAMTFATGCDTLAGEEKSAPPGWVERGTLTGDWGGGRTWLKEHGITLMPRLTHFYQGMTSGDGDHGFENGGKADLLLHSDLGKLGLWNGFSMTIHAEYNYGQSVNGRGGTLAPVNTALYLPGMEAPIALTCRASIWGRRSATPFPWSSARST